MNPIRRLLVCVSWSAVCWSSLAASTAKMTLRVVDEAGAPVSGAEASVYLGALNGDLAKGLTDNDGLFTGTVRFNSWLVSWGAKKTGYYRSHDMMQLRPGFLNRLQPWNPTQVVVLRPILHPVAMYARRAVLELPRLDQPCAYDLVAGDWVAPDGKGRSPHMIFTGRREYAGWDDWKAWLEVSFAGKTAGYVLQESDPEDKGSDYKLPREAPSDGYAAIYQAFRKSRTASWPDATKSFLFRTATQENVQGGTTAALHGKIRGPIHFDPRTSGTLTISFVYYLNPDGTRNLEFDPKRNLFKDKIPDLELEDRP